MQDITEQQEIAQEISDAISRPVGFGEDFDEVGVLTSYNVNFMVKIEELPRSTDIQQSSLNTSGPDVPNYILLGK